MVLVWGTVGAVKVTSTADAVGLNGKSGIGPKSWPSMMIEVVPVGRTPPGGLVATNTVKVTSSPPTTGLVSLLIVVAVSALFMVWPTLPELAVNPDKPDSPL